MTLTLMMLPGSKKNPELGIELNEDNVCNIKELIDRCIDDPSFEKGREKARAETWIPIGNGAKLTVDFIMEKYEEVKAKKAKENTQDSQPITLKKKKVSLKKL